MKMKQNITPPIQEYDFKSEQIKFEMIANSIPQLAWLTDETGYIYWYNQRWYDYTGTTYGSMKGWGWQAVHHPDHIDRVINKLKIAFEEKKEWEDTFPLRSKSGEYRWFLSRAKIMYDEGGNVIGWFGTNTDVTDEINKKNTIQHSEQRLRSIIDNMLAFVGELDTNGVLKEINQSALNIAGLKRDDVIGKYFWDCYWWNYDEAVTQRLKQAFEDCLNGEIIRYDEIVRIENNGRMDLSYKMAPVMDESGQIIKIIPSGVDITERKKAELDLQKSIERKSNFIATLSHELRNPLSPIISVLSLMSRGMIPENKQPQMIETALNSADHLAKLIDDLLDITRIQKGKITLQITEFNLCDIIQSAIDENISKAQEKQHTINYPCHGDEVIIKADKTRMRQAVSNIISNAIKYCPPQCNIDIHVLNAENNVEITITDNGPGIPEGMLNDVFDPFIQVEAPINRTEDGLGIGLSLVRELISLHNGFVSAKNRQEGGLEVVITLPKT
jgi:PAS domain S-box-containing protein